MRATPVLLVLGSVVSVQAGQAFGKQLFAQAGPGAVVALRLGFAALVLLAIHRPSLPSRRELVPVLGFGAAIAGMNLIYPALLFLPMGVASALQLLGPLAIAVATARRARDVALSLVAGFGVWLFHAPSGTTMPAAGVALALLSAASMGGYLLLSRKVGASVQDGSMLALAVTVAAVLVMPFGATTAVWRPSLLLAGFGVAVLSAVVPYSLDLAALRRIPPGTVAVLESLEAAVAGLAGAVLLGERLPFAAWAGIACVTASAAATGRAAARNL
ncbi:EamA family transporter [Amycolatopsis thermophila]|uniref:Inner membrane transporter RhtA n=1 Tax=Amycolatopsis thermophila TaxID=206084 RepID=A0ABU0ESE0_9PSEU|nr:EamA family transporter [Amycolatopsis thermophila]MDQ0378211.1 inner membrane transporter RhtA [Amycolatopsis thermophila]